MLVDMADGVLYFWLLVGHAPHDEQATRSLGTELTRPPVYPAAILTASIQTYGLSARPAGKPEKPWVDSHLASYRSGPY